MKVNVHVDLTPKAVKVLVEGVDKETAVDVGVATPEEETYQSQPVAEMPVPETEEVAKEEATEEEKPAEEK